MISYLKGYVLKKLEKSLIVDVQGVGYEVKSNTNLISDIKENEDIEVFIHTHVREDDISLYGFGSYDELELFKLLISVSGIGPRIGLELLNQPVEMLKNAIYMGDNVLLAKTPGLGAKTAAKLVLELKSKVTPSALPKSISANIPSVGEIIEALENLGYNRHQITLGLKRLDTENLSTEEIITSFLKEAYQK
ncbi:MAG: Holliday junction branch migration protein RuvA [Candidatus Peregrinibacteria bacterium]|nr:Holliday junction branch migration protein RuvA [Candidatus Peregrinibacteria bacterium]MDZ4244863.1 Holliday junction branch migration protein RuvA [Candidatus Gracilibacteria bacterium]